MANCCGQFRSVCWLVFRGGTYILAFFGISASVVQVGGGMVLIAMGWATLMESDEGCDKSVRKGVEPQDRISSGVLPFNIAADDWFRINLRCSSRWEQTRHAVALFILCQS
jgi:hypothetical protein